MATVTLNKYEKDMIIARLVQSAEKEIQNRVEQLVLRYQQAEIQHLVNEYIYSEDVNKLLLATVKKAIGNKGV